MEFDTSRAHRAIKVPLLDRCRIHSSFGTFSLMGDGADHMSNPDSQRDAAAEVLSKVKDDLSLPRIYTNGFAVGLSNADITVVLQLSGRPTHVMHMSFTLAKTLAQRLGRVVSEFETVLSTELITTDKIDAAFAKRKEAE